MGSRSRVETVSVGTTSGILIWFTCVCILTTALDACSLHTVTDVGEDMGPEKSKGVYSSLQDAGMARVTVLLSYWLL